MNPFMARVAAAGWLYPPCTMSGVPEHLKTCVENVLANLHMNGPLEQGLRVTPLPVFGMDTA